MNLDFSFKKVKEETPEKYPTLAVMTFMGGDNVTKFALNKKAIELLGYNEGDNRVLNYARNTDTDELLLVNTNGTVKDNSCVVNRDNTINNKALYNRIGKVMGIHFEEGHEFLLSIPEMEAPYKVLVINNISPLSQTSDDFLKFPDDSFVEENIQDSEFDGIQDAPIGETMNGEVTERL